MILKTFKQTTSITGRLKRIMSIIVIFIVFCTIIVYISSINTLHGLQNLNSANILLNFNSQAIEIVNSAENNLDRTLDKKSVDELQLLHDKDSALLFKLTNDSIIEAESFPELIAQLKTFNEIQIQYDLHYRSIVQKLNQSLAVNKAKAEILLARQLLLEAKEVLGKIQFFIKNEATETFAKTYKNRFEPIAVASIVAIIFFVFVITFGLSISKKIELSLSNLLKATNRISQGDLEHQAKILEFDEIGQLTNAFNNMVVSLKSTQDNLNQSLERSRRLQNIAASLSEALIPDQVYTIIFEQAYEFLGADSASIALLSADKNFLEIQKMEGVDKEIYLKWKRVPVTSDLPITEVLHFGSPLFSSIEDLKRYSALDAKEDEVILAHTMACLPLLIGSERLGVLAFSFTHDRQFNQDEKDFMMALARQCAQAIHRSMLYDNAKQAVEARDEFLSIASHELRTPLTPLKLQIQGIARQAKNGKISSLTPEQLQKMAESSERQINRLSTLIDDLLDVSRITSGKFNLKKDYCSLKEIINEAIVQYSQRLQDIHNQIDFVVEKDTIGLWDKIRIEQVVTNLLSNASKYAPNKTIHINILNKNHIAKIEIRDEGPGIALEDRDRIFNRFERVASRENLGGLGLGLYISKQIIDAHKGKLYVERSSDLGSVFVVELPEENLT